MKCSKVRSESIIFNFEIIAWKYIVMLDLLELAFASVTNQWPEHGNILEGRMQSDCGMKP